MQMNRTNRGQQMSQRELYDWIAMLGFCAVDMMLYLDTHPDDEDALNYFNQCTAMQKQPMRNSMVRSMHSAAL